MSEGLIRTSVQISPKIDLSIEGMNSQKFSVGVFYFLLVGILVFSVIIYMVMKSPGGPPKMRRGEKIMFGAIIMGVIVAIIFAATQMVFDFLF